MHDRLTSIRDVQSLGANGRSGSIAAVSYSGGGMASTPYITYWCSDIASVRIELQKNALNPLKSRDRAQN